MMHTPEYSTHTIRLNKEVLALPALEPAVTEVAILATLGHYTGSFGGGFLTYSHSRIVASKGLLTEDQMKKITEGEKPTDLSERREWLLIWPHGWSRAANLWSKSCGKRRMQF